MRTGIIKSNPNSKTQTIAEGEVNFQLDHMMGYILRNMYIELGKNYSYEEIKEILKYKINFENKFYRK